MRSVTVTGVVPATPERVWDLLVDSRNDERWCPMATGYQLVEGEPGLGAVYAYDQSAGPGRTVRTRIRTTVADRPRTLAWETAGRGPDYASRIELEPHDDGTRLRQTNRVRMTNPVEQAAWFAGAQVVLRLQLRNLSQLLG